MKTILLLLTFGTLVFLYGCEPERQDIFYGEEECTHCNMIISEPKFSSQLLTNKGKYYNFDSIECLAGFITSKSLPTEDIHSAWVISFNSENWVLAQDAHYLKSGNLQSPMSLNLSAYSNLEVAKEYQRNYTGEILSWNDIQNFVHKEWNN
ncbi:MAG: nitrous oxide reductase accessory protein NosL [Balneolales bacterium]